MNRMKIPSVNISPRVQCGNTAGKTSVGVTQSNSKLHCRDFVRMSFSSGFLFVVKVGGLPNGHLEREVVAASSCQRVPLGKYMRSRSTIQKAKKEMIPKKK